MAKYTDADLASIKGAIASGTRAVTYADGRKVEFQSLDHMLAAQKVIEAEIAMQDAAASGIVRRRVPYYRSGLT